MKLKKETWRMLIAVNLLAFAIILDLITNAIPGLNLSMPFGGKFFGISMLPLVLIGLLVGLKYGLMSGLIYALYNFGIDYIIYLETLRVTLESWTGIPWTFGMIVALIMFDYVIPFMAFGLSGIFKDGLKEKKKFVYAVLFVSGIRLISSTISGVILWGSSIAYASEQVALGNDSHNLATRLFAFVGDNLVLYSFGYNFIYIFTTSVAVIGIGLLIFKRLQVISQNLEESN
ncbi:MAG: energy-coupled thiamine transporter ThiT [Acholeplasmataceae bacterium]|nr:energy-coupled thiamine transporter ThiT [Acholeplasmataceae bacterium]